MVSVDKESEATLESVLYIYQYSSTKEGRKGSFTRRVDQLTFVKSFSTTASA